MSRIRLSHSSYQEPGKTQPKRKDNPEMLILRWPKCWNYLARIIIILSRFTITVSFSVKGAAQLKYI